MCFTVFLLSSATQCIHRQWWGPKTVTGKSWLLGYLQSLVSRHSCSMSNTSCHFWLWIFDHSVPRYRSEGLVRLIAKQHFATQLEFLGGVGCLEHSIPKAHPGFAQYLFGFFLCVFLFHPARESLLMQQIFSGIILPLFFFFINYPPLLSFFFPSRPLLTPFILFVYNVSL